MNSINSFLDEIAEGSRPSLDDFIKALHPVSPLLSQLATTPQNPKWHAEGNVFNHTERVLEAIYKLLEHEAQSLDKNQKLILILSALFHDIGKPLATIKREVNGEIQLIAPHHEKRGASYLFYRLQALTLLPDTLHQIIHLVAYHDQPKHLVTKNQPKKAYLQLARLVDVELLYFLEKADVQGRICQNQKGELENIELFQLFCKEHHIWQKPHPYNEWKEVIANQLPNCSKACERYIYGCGIKDYEAGSISSPWEACAKYYKSAYTHSQLFIMCGPSGVGKSSWIGQNLPHFEVISLDDLREAFARSRSDQGKNKRVLSEAKQHLRECLRKKQNVVWDATNMRKDFRSLICQIGFNYQALVTIGVMQSPLPIIYDKNRKRSYPLPVEILDNQLTRFQLVEKEEAHYIEFL